MSQYIIMHFETLFMQCSEQRLQPDPQLLWQCSIYHHSDWCLG